MIPSLRQSNEDVSAVFNDLKNLNRFGVYKAETDNMQTHIDHDEEKAPVEHVKQNAAALGLELSEQDLEALDRAFPA